MANSNRPIFRVDAVRRYSEARERSVLPRIISPRVTLMMWLLLGLLLAGGSAAWAADVPVYESGVATVVDEATVEWHFETSASGDDASHLAVVAFLAPESLSQLQPGQDVVVEIGPGAERFHGKVVAVQSEVLSPEQARQEFKLDSGAGLVVTRPSAVAVTRVEVSSSSESSTSASSYTGSVGRIEVESEKRRLTSLLPVIGRYLDRLGGPH